MNTPLNFDEQPSEEWKKLKKFVAPLDARQNTNADNDFEESVVTKILVSSLAPVKAPDNFEDEVMRRIAAESEPVAKPTAGGLERIASALRTRTAAVIGIVALISGGTLSIYTLTQDTAHVAPLKQQVETEIDLSPVPVQLDTRFEKQTPQEKTKTPAVKTDSSKLPIKGGSTPPASTKDEDDLF